MQGTDSPDTAISPSEPAKTVGVEHGPVSSKAAKLLGLHASSSPTNNKPGRHSTRHAKATHPRPARSDPEAGTRTTRIKDPVNPAHLDQEAPGRTEEILQRLLSRRRNVILCLIFLFSIVIAVSVVSGLQKGDASGAAESTKSLKQPPQTSSTSSSHSSFTALSSQAPNLEASSSITTSVGPSISQVGAGGGQLPSSSLKRRMVVFPTYQRTTPTSIPL